MRVDVEGRAPDTETAIAGADMGCADTLTMHDGSTLTLPEHEEALEKALKAQRAMSGCVRGSRQWKDNLECLRTQRRAMQHRDHDAVRKSACEIARAYDVLGLESLNIKGMGSSARARSDTGVGAKRALNRRIRAGLWGFTQTTLANAMEAAGGVALRAGHGLEPHRRRVRTRGRREPQREGVPLHSVRTRRRCRRERGEGDAPARPEMARVEIGRTQ